MFSQRPLPLFALLFVSVASLQAQQNVPAVRTPSQNAQPTVASPGGSSPEISAIATQSASLGEPVGAETERTQIKDSLAVLARLLGDYQKSGNRPGQADTLCAIAKTYSILGQQQKAIDQFQLALAIYREVRDTSAQANALTQIGDVYRAWGFPRLSLPFYRDALAAYSQTTKDADKVITLNNLGVAYLSLGDKRKCLSYLKQALATYHSINDQQGEALALNNLGMAYFALSNDAHKAVASFQDALTKLQLTDDHDAEATVLDNMGAVCMKHGRKELAATSFDHALQLYREARDARGETRVLLHMKMLSGSSSISSTQSNPIHPWQ